MAHGQPQVLASRNNLQLNQLISRRNDLGQNGRLRCEWNVCFESGCIRWKMLSARIKWLQIKFCLPRCISDLVLKRGSLKGTV
ncbi:hypothetical protein CDAR_478101 [Caerostris darwini]|uniref:Uncharacterized protein n=1 Tax=Caerostris darwini TaxID=1538125 RepID=A0AAV4PZJ4_9ARAC|nr:hypothetical protein CDAR_478101 [Caerostris darwini]